MRRGALLSVAFPLLAACGESEPKRDPPPAPLVFVGEEGGPGPAVTLRGRNEGDRIVIDVVASSVETIRGAAFRLHWDSADLSFEVARGSDAWPPQSLLIAKEGAPGELVVAWTEKGSPAAIRAQGETRLGSIAFVRRRPTATRIAFRAERSLLLDGKGAPVVASWRGGVLAADAPR